MNIYITLTISGGIGIVLRSFRNIVKINKANANVNLGKVFKIYWTNERLSLLMSVVCFGAILFVSDEIVDFSQVDHIDFTQSLKERLLHFRISNFIRATFIVFGYLSNKLVYGTLGVTAAIVKEKFSDLLGKD